MRTPDERAANTAYAARRRHAQWMAKAESRTTCPAALARGVKCGWRLESRMVDGVTVPFCPQCERKRRGISLDCRKEPVQGTVGRALRCRHCHKVERAAAEKRWAQKHPGTIRAQWRARKKRLLADGNAYAAHLARKKLWRQAMPTATAKARLAWNKTAAAKAYQRRYRETHRAELAAKAREYQRKAAAGIPTSHPCSSCGAALHGRQKKCTACQQRDFRAARRVLVGAAA